MFLDWKVKNAVAEIRKLIQNSRSQPQFSRVHQNHHIEFRIILLNVLRPILLPEFLNDRLHSLHVGDRHGSELRLDNSCINPNFWSAFLYHWVVGAAHGEQV